MGFGCMGLTGVYNSPVSDEDGISIIVAAFNKGITFFDTADVYGPHTNELLVGKVCNSKSTRSITPTPVDRISVLLNLSMY